MQKLLLVLIAAAAVIGTTVYIVHQKQHKTDVNPVVPTPAYDAWVHWKAAHGKQYAPAEEKQKLAVWYASYQKIMNHNLKNDKTYTLGFNQFMDLNTEQFKTLYLTLKPKASYEPTTLDDSNLATDVDWRTKGAVTAVKDQGQCGSCWAFSTTGSLEGAHYLATKTLTSFSEQQLVDCSTQNSGCNGGLMDYAFAYVKQNGITTEAKYPYHAVDQTCKTKEGVWKISSYTDVPQGSDSQLKAAVAKQPVAIAVDAEAWQFYGGGVFSDCGTSLDHGVLLVGYSGSKYWTVKNSWASSWGESGYIRLAMGNTCGLENSASYPVA